MRASGTAPLQRSTAAGSDTFEVPQLVALAASGKLRVPNFQRSFVWDASDVRQLFDSIYRGFPIGTLLLWKQPVPAARVSFGPVTFDAHEDSDGLVVVDGQQRITSIVASLLHSYEGIDERFEVFFDFQKRRFIGLSRGARPAHSMPIREALESRTLLAWLRDNGDELENDDLEVADELAAALRQYRIPAYVVAGDDETVLREVFDRVNSAGKPISRAQVFHALFANESEPGSPATVVDSLNKTTGFGSIAENRVVQSLLAIRGGDVQRDLHDEFGEDEDPADWYDQTERALHRSVEFLKREGVPHQSLLPSSFPLPVLAAFFHLHPDPTPWIESLLSRWLWRGWVHGFGREGGQTPSLRRAVRSINPKKNQIHLVPDEYDAVKLLLDSVKDTAVDNLELKTFRTDNANARLVLLALATLNPKQPSDAAAIDVAQVLSDRGVQVIGQLVPGHRTAIGSRGYWLEEFGYLTGNEEASVLDSHLVPHEAALALRGGDIERFVYLRGEAVTRLTLGLLDSKLATGALVRPPLSDLVIPDSDL